MASSTPPLKHARTAREKLETEHPSHGKPFIIPTSMARRLGEGTMIVPRPLDVEAMMRLPRRGRLITVGQIRATLAARAGVDTCCPLTTGIFMRLAAEAAEEDAAIAGLRPVTKTNAPDGRHAADATRAAAPRKKSTRAQVITPWWRTIRDDGKLIDKFPGGVKAQAAQLRSEGHTILPAKGMQPPKVSGYERKLWGRGLIVLEATSKRKP